MGIHLEAYFVLPRFSFVFIYPFSRCVEKALDKRAEQQTHNLCGGTRKPFVAAIGE